MARVWRDGQKKTVHIYRLLTTVITSKLSVCYFSMTRSTEVSSKNDKYQRGPIREHFNISTLALQTAAITIDSLEEHKNSNRCLLHFCPKFQIADRTFLHLRLQLLTVIKSIDKLLEIYGIYKDLKALIKH